VSVTEQLDAKKKSLGPEDAKALLKAAEEVYVAKGKKLIHFHMKDVDFNEVLAVILGPTGNLRAPTFRKGKTLVVGFDEVTYRAVLG
jgi:hypothetical protein